MLIKGFKIPRIELRTVHLCQHYSLFMHNKLHYTWCGDYCECVRPAQLLNFELRPSWNIHDTFPTGTAQDITGVRDSFRFKGVRSDCGAQSASWSLGTGGKAVPPLRMSWALPRFPINTFVVCTKTALPFPLSLPFQSRLILIILVGGLGVEDQQNGLYDVWILLDMIIFLMGLGQSGSRPIKTKNTDGLHLWIFNIFAAVPLDFLRKSFESLSLDIFCNSPTSTAEITFVSDIKSTDIMGNVRSTG